MQDFYEKQFLQSTVYKFRTLLTTYNCSFSDYINRLRVEYAERILHTAPHSTKLSQIAQESGFASEASFYRNFKKFAGVTPADWQRHANDSSDEE